MNSFLKKNINLLLGIFLVCQPILDLLTGLCLHLLNINLTIGILVRIIFLLLICYTALFVFKKKKLLIPYLGIIIYFLLYTIGIIIYKDGVGLFKEIQELVKVFYFPILLISLYSIRDKIRISKMTLFTTLFLYLIFIFIPLSLGLGYQSYQITKVGTLGFYNSANEISGIISLLTPIMFIVLSSSKKIIPKVLLVIIYLVVILMIGTKTPLLTLLITVGFSLIYFWSKSIKEKQFKNLFISVLILLIGISSLIIIMPKTNFYKNIETHLDYLELDNIGEVFEDEELIDHFIFSQRLTFFAKKARLYNKASLYQKLFGIGYLRKNKVTKMIEMDYFDIYYSHGLIGFLLFFTMFIYVLYKVLRRNDKMTYERYMSIVSLMLIIFLAFFTGHIITAPAVSLISIIIILSLEKREKKDLLFASYSMDLGGIEKALLNLINRIDLDKYNVRVVLEDKRGIFLDLIDSRIIVDQLKVFNNKNIIIRKSLNYLNKLIFKILNYHNYDFSCCYATYSYSSSKIALISSKNTAFYVHNDYRTIYKDENDFRNFFDSRNISDYKHIIFVSNENREGFIEIYKQLTKKCKVFNNFINTKEIIEQSKEKISAKKNKDKTLLMYVGRLDDDAKKISRQINLVKNIEKLELWIIGDGPDREKYVKEVKDNHLEKRVTFFGKQKNPFPYMKQADYVILTSDYEGFPVTYLEAITLNKNIITTFPTSDDVVDINEYGNVIDKNQNKMIEQVKKIMKNKKNIKKIDLESGQVARMRKLEKIFDEVV